MGIRVRDRESVRTIVRTATESLNEGLHRHWIFQDLLQRRHSLPRYRDLLLCFYGFHAPMEARLASALSACGRIALTMNGRCRAHLLVKDLRDLGTGEAVIAEAPICDRLPEIHSPARFLGALYVVDGFKLGGRFLYRQLDYLLGAHGGKGRLFFSDDAGASHKRLREYCAALEAFASVGGDVSKVVASARDTFSAISDWLDRFSAPDDSLVSISG